MSETVDGYVAPGWEPVADAFAANFEHGEVGAACCVYAGRRSPKVDLVGGIADPTTGRPWTSDTIALVFSTTKGATAVCANLLIQRGASRSRRAGRAVLARVRRERQGRSARPARAVARRGPARHRRRPHPGRRAGVGSRRRTTRAAGPTVGARARGRLPRAVLRVAGRRTRPPHHRRHPGSVLRASTSARPLELDWWIGLPEALEARVAADDHAPAPDRSRGPGTDGRGHGARHLDG